MKKRQFALLLFYRYVYLQYMVCRTAAKIIVINVLDSVDSRLHERLQRLVERPLYDDLAH